MDTMETMDEFLRRSKTALLNLEMYKNVRVVMGNNTCDLDSAVCTLVQAYSEYLDTIMEGKSNKVAIIPLMNIPRSHYRIKTEVVYMFKRHNIPPSLLTFRDDINLKVLKKNLAKTGVEVVLVDHHVLSEEDNFLTDSVIRVIDHRPLDSAFRYSHKKCDVCIENVGSCATLVARRFLFKHLEYATTEIRNLLVGPILIDTCNLSMDVARVTPMDIEVLELLGVVGPQERNSEYSRLLEAKTDISELSPDDLLMRDTKVVDGVPIVGLPILLRKFINAESKEIRLNAICNFARARNSRIVVLYGMQVKSNNVQRDLALFLVGSELEESSYDPVTIRAYQIYEQMQISLFSTELAVENRVDCVGPKGCWQYMLVDQRNLSATRKQLLPIIQGMIRNISDFRSINETPLR